ncbi:hypothetical protein QBC43DRAFT_323948 [Cladorrhinum sp. PSN259]|nr:hypothetical protein QBC43DRAFT_323948 [Cladorrhinum sp. PSN259]
MAALEPITTVLSLLNETFTLAQTTSALISAPEEIKRAVELIYTVQCELDRTKLLRNRAFDVLDPDVARDETFTQIQHAIRKADSAVTASSHTLTGSKKKDKYGSLRTRFSWVAGGQRVFDGNVQELQLHHMTLLHYMSLLERKLEKRGVKTGPRQVLPFGDCEDDLSEGGLKLFGGGGLLSPPPPPPGAGDGISLLIGPRRSREFLLGEGEEGHDSGIGSVSGGSSGDEGDGDTASREGGSAGATGLKARSEFTVMVLEPDDDDKVDDVFLERLSSRQRQS